MRGFLSRLSGAAVAVVLSMSAVPAAAMTVQPVVVDLKMAGREMSAPIRVENNGPNPLPVEIRIVESEFAADSVRASDRASEDLLVFPPQALIAPGATQVFRLQYVGDPGAATSKHYYAEVAQLPVELPEGQSAIQILYNFQVMVNVGTIGAKPPALAISDVVIVKNADNKDVFAFTVTNATPNYGYLSNGRLTFIQKDGGKDLVRRTLSSNDIQQQIGYGLIGPNTSRRFISPVEAQGPAGTAEVVLAADRPR